MKIKDKIFVLTVSILFFSFHISAQESNKKIDTTQFKVKGVCNMCKTRIENASLIKGVKFTEWNKETQVITIIYKSDKVSRTDLELAVAESGHDTENVHANRETYEKLPDCCAYRDGVHIH